MATRDQTYGMRDGREVCDVCDEYIEGEPAGHGLLLFVRGDRIEREEPPLCGRCATAVMATASMRWQLEEEG